MRAEAGEKWCYETLRRVRWPHGITCPFCGRGHATTHSKSPVTPRRRYLCLKCRRTFTDFTGTPLARTNLPLTTWFACLQLVDDRLTTSELARKLGVKWDTGVRMQRQLVIALGRPGFIRELRATARDMERTPGRLAPRSAAP